MVWHPHPPPPQAFILSLSEHILILSLYYKAFVSIVRLHSLLHVVLITYYETFHANIGLQFLLHMQIPAVCCKTKIDDGWLAKGKDPKKLKESFTNIVTIVIGVLMSLGTCRYCASPQPFLLEGEVEPPIKFSKRGGLTRLQLWEWGYWKRGSNFFKRGWGGGGVVKFLQKK